MCTPIGRCGLLTSRCCIAWLTALQVALSSVLAQLSSEHATLKRHNCASAEPEMLQGCPCRPHSHRSHGGKCPTLQASPGPVHQK